MTATAPSRHSMRSSAAGIQKRDSQTRCGPLSALPRDDKLFWLCLDVLQGQLK